MTQNTIDRLERLIEEFTMIGKQGYCIDGEELVAGMVAIAVPVETAQA